MFHQHQQQSALNLPKKRGTLVFAEAKNLKPGKQVVKIGCNKVLRVMEVRGKIAIVQTAFYHPAIIQEVQVSELKELKAKLNDKEVSLKLSQWQRALDEHTVGTDAAFTIEVRDKVVGSEIIEYGKIIGGYPMVTTAQVSFNATQVRYSSALKKNYTHEQVEALLNKVYTSALISGMKTPGTKAADFETRMIERNDYFRSLGFKSIDGE